jgi:hypothetical protein
MTTTTTPRVRKARRDGICVFCHRWISIGQLITNSDRGWVHARCLLPAPPTNRKDQP